MAGLSALLGANPITAGIGMAANVLGGIANVVGAVGQKKEAERQMYAQEAFGKKQRESFKTGYGDLISQAKGLSTYQGDISRYTKMEQIAQEAKRAAGAGQVAGEGIMREQARQTTANTLAAAQRGATSSSDLLTAALMGQQQEGAQMQNIDIQSQQQRQAMQQQAQQNYMASLGQTAAAQAQQMGLEFQSKSQKEQQLLGLTESQFKEGMSLEDQLFGQEQAKAAAVQNAKSAIWSGIGGIAQSIGGGLMGMNAQQNQMDMLKNIYGGIGTSAYQAGTIQQRMGNISSAIGANKMGATPSLGILSALPNITQQGIGRTPLNLNYNATNRSLLGNYQ